jgi:threonine/homoserine/homoserine lactone efflux protein
LFVADALSAFAVVALLFALTPGPDIFLVLKHSSRGGSRHGIAVAIGAASGSLVWGVAAAVGLAAVIEQSALVYNFIRYVGAAYLLFLGISTIWAARHRNSTADAEHKAVAREPLRNRSRAAAFRTGVLANLLNPKMGIFYVAILPQFVPSGADVLTTSVLLTLIELVMSAVVLAAVALLAAHAAALLAGTRLRQWLDRIVGAVLVALGIGVASQA